MLELERQFSPHTTTRIVASETQRLTAEQHRRDIFETHRQRVFAVGFYMTANELEAEELLASTFVTAFARQPSPDAATVDRALVEELEKRFSLDEAEAATPDPHLLLTKANTRRTDMEEALRLLPPGERLIFLLRDVEGYSTARIAAVLDKPENEIQRTLFSGRIRMRNAVAAAQQAAQRARRSKDGEPEPEETGTPALSQA